MEPVGETLRRIKQAPDSVLQGGAIPILKETRDLIGSLEPIGYELAGRPEVIALLTRWREANRRFFFTQFGATEEGTALWLKTVVLSDPHRVLFFIREEKGRRIGHYGLCNVRDNRAELDNLVRGERGGDRRLIFYAELALMHWAFRRLDVEEIRLEAFGNNTLALAIHQDVGFNLVAREPMVREEHPWGIIWKATSAAQEGAPERWLVRMALDRGTFLSRYPWLNRVGREERGEDGFLEE